MFDFIKKPKFMRDDHGILQLVYIAVYLGIAVAAGAITLFIANQVVTITGTPTGGANVAASGTLTFTGNVGCGERVNITSSTGVLVPFIFNTSVGCHEGVLPQNGNSINITFTGAGSNTSVFGATNLSGYINANTTLNAELAATNSTNLTIVTFSTTGGQGNSVLTTDTLANGSWTAATLTGGANSTVAGRHLANASNNLMNTADTGYSFLPIVAVAAIGAIAIGYVFGLIPGMGRKGEGGGGI